MHKKHFFSKNFDWIGFWVSECPAVNPFKKVFGHLQPKFEQNRSWNYLCPIFASFTRCAPTVTSLLLEIIVFNFQTGLGILYERASLKVRLKVRVRGR